MRLSLIPLACLLVVGGVAAAQAAPPATCDTLTPASLRQTLATGRLSFVIDDEAQSPTRLYLTIKTIKNDGVFTAALAETLGDPRARPSNGAAPPVAPGTLTRAAPEVLAVAFAYTWPYGEVSTYQGAIQQFSNCRLLFAGIYRTTLLGPKTDAVGVAPDAIPVFRGPFPFSARPIKRLSID